MGKLYHTHEVKDVFDEKLNSMILEAANDSELTGSSLGSVIEKIRLFRMFALTIMRLPAASAAEARQPSTSKWPVPALPRILSNATYGPLKDGSTPMPRL